jgi:serine protease Do
MQKDIAKIKNAQYQQHLTINKIKDSLERSAPDAEVNASGTAFALTNNGYLVTNYHVVNGADSVYIRTRDGRYYRTFTVAYDEQNDIALLKVEHKNFRFGKGEVPYSFAAGKSPLGARVYSIGFPQHEIVYNEGYVSARNGFHSNPAQYRLDLPANPGQSGAPVLDAQGNVIAIVTANETESATITYAVSTEALHKLLHTLPKQMNIHLPRHSKLGRLSREQQIERLQDYTCLVQVYK